MKRKNMCELLYLFPKIRGTKIKYNEIHFININIILPNEKNN